MVGGISFNREDVGCFNTSMKSCTFLGTRTVLTIISALVLSLLELVRVMESVL
jgi:hypothetical protein